MKITCPNPQCKTPIEAPDTAIGKPLKCSACGSGLMVVTCPQCMRKLPVPAHAFGKKGKCGACKAEIHVAVPRGASAPVTVPASSKSLRSTVAQNPPAAAASKTVAPPTVAKSVAPVATGSLRPIDPKKFLMPEVIYTGRKAELEVSPEMQRLEFDTTHNVLLAFPEKGLPLSQAWQLGTWIPVTVDWLPTRSLIETRKELSVDSSEVEIRSEFARGGVHGSPAGWRSIVPSPRVSCASYTPGRSDVERQIKGGQSFISAAKLSPSM